MEKAPNRAFNQEKALVGAFPVILELRVIFAKVRSSTAQATMNENVTSA